MRAFKLLHQRKDGSLGPLFINRSQRIPLGEWLEAEDHPTKGFAHRPGWHCSSRPHAPHLVGTKAAENRVWAAVEINDFYEIQRPVIQGGLWYIAQKLRVLSLLPPGGDHAINRLGPSLSS